jgi:hypothetical protein
MFHEKLDSETHRGFTGNLTVKQRSAMMRPEMTLSDFDLGLLLGILIGEGHFGGDGRQPQITVRMHVRHERLFDQLLRLCPGSKLYGPYHHGGRSYYQWMIRGAPLREHLLPILDRVPIDTIDEHAFTRYQDMKRKYAL